MRVTKENAKQPITRTVCHYAIHADEADGCDLIHIMTVTEVFRNCGGVYESCPEYRRRGAGSKCARPNTAVEDINPQMSRG
jgi:hypothetical protein